MGGHRTTRLLWRYGLYAALLVVFALFLIWPIALTVYKGFVGPDGGFTLRYFIGDVGVLNDPAYRRGLVNALLIAVCTTTGCFLLTLPMALIASRWHFPGKGLITALILVPLILPPFVGAIGIRQLLGRFGSINTLLALTFDGWSEAALWSLGAAVVAAVAVAAWAAVGLTKRWRGVYLLAGIAGIGVAAALVMIGLFMSPLAKSFPVGVDKPGIDWLGGQIGGRFWCVVVMEVLHLYPILYLNLTAALANLDPSLEEAAENLGASRWRRLRKVTLPLILPGAFAGGTIVFIWSFTELGTPLMFDYYEVTPVQVFNGIKEIASNPRPYALVVVMLVVALVLYAAGKLAFGGRGYAMQGKATAMATLQRPRGWRGAVTLAGIYTLFLGVTGLAILPHLGVVLMSVSTDAGWYRSVLPTEVTGDHYMGALTHGLAAQSIGNSLMYAVAAMLLCIVMGLAIAYLVVRVRVKGGIVLDTLGMLPLAVPGLVMAFGFVAMSLQWPFTDWTGSDGQTIVPAVLGAFQVLGEQPNPILLLVIAYTIRRLPYILRSASAGLEQTSGDLEEAALNLGASPLLAIRRVVVPLIMANLIAGGILVFSFAMLEVSDSLLLAQAEPHYPITKAIWTLYSRLGDGRFVASAMGVWAMALLTVTLVGASVLMGKRLGAIFRV